LRGCERENNKNKNKNNRMASTTGRRASSVRDFREGQGDESHFQRLNESWLFANGWGIEAKDAKIFEQAVELILRPGGRIFFIEEEASVEQGAGAGVKEELEAKGSNDKPSAPVGCCALLKLDDYEGKPTMELIKLGVDPSAQGRGYGRKLIEHAIAQAREMGVKRLYLESNKVLTPALKLYLSVGFVHLPPERVPTSDYARADVFMEMDL
jgi:GNAT superfamily N-acetyltransferase